MTKLRNPETGEIWDSETGEITPPKADDPPGPPTGFTDKVDRTEGFGSRVQRNIEDVPRQLGLTARAGIQGLSDLTGIFSDPIATTMSWFTDDPVPRAGQMGENVSDWLGLPKPQTPFERIVQHGAGAMAGMGGISGTANAVKNIAKHALPVIERKAPSLLSSLAENPGLQQSAGAGAGLLSSTVAETGGPVEAQIAASFGGGFLGGGLPILIKNMSKLAMEAYKSFRAGSAPTPQSITNRLNSILNESGINPSDLPKNVRDDMLAAITSASKSDGVLNPQVLRRLADYAQVGATPRLGNVTLDPVLLTKEKNLAKIGAGSDDPSLNALSRAINANDRQLTAQVNELGANRAGLLDDGGALIAKAMKEVDAPEQAAVSALYKAVRDSSGRSAQMDVPLFSNTVNAGLAKEQLGLVLPKSARKILNDFSDGSVPFLADTVMQTDKALTRMKPKLITANDQEALLALKIMQTALREAVPASGAGRATMKAYTTAREAAAKRFAAIDRNPARKSAILGDAPDKFFTTFITGGSGKANFSNIKALVGDLGKVPGALDSVRNQLLQHLKEKALGLGNADDVGNFSAAGFNREMARLGDNKLGLLFDEPTMKMLKAIGRVASYEKHQPAGAAVNNANTGAFAFNIFEKIMQRLGFVGTAQNLKDTAAAKISMEPKAGLLTTAPTTADSMVAPTVLPGLLGMTN